MLNVLINAYAVSPIRGSEPGMGWNWVCNLARFCNLHVITEGEWRNEIEAMLHMPDTTLTEVQRAHLHFHYLPVEQRIRDMCWNQGDWRFYIHYAAWQKRAYAKARELLSTYDIDIIHQLNMIGFREPGYLWEITDKPFVWGPIGGMELMSTAYLHGAPLGVQLKQQTKNLINRFQRRFQLRVRRALHRADAIAAATDGDAAVISEFHHVAATRISETGCYPREQTPDGSQPNQGFNLLWVGKFDYRKQLGIALQTMAQLKSYPQIHLDILGDGYEKDVRKYHQLMIKLGVQDAVTFHGNVPLSRVHEMMRKAHLFFFTSIMDATSTVVLEAIQNNLPIICHQCCGFGSIVDNTIGRKIPLNTQKVSADLFAKAIIELYENRSLLDQMKEHCRQKQSAVSWESNARKMLDLYAQAQENFRQHPS